MGENLSRHGCWDSNLLARPLRVVLQFDGGFEQGHHAHLCLPAYFAADPEHHLCYNNFGSCPNWPRCVRDEAVENESSDSVDTTDDHILDHADDESASVAAHCCRYDCCIPEFGLPVGGDGRAPFAHNTSPFWESQEGSGCHHRRRCHLLDFRPQLQC